MVDEYGFNEGANSVRNKKKHIRVFVRRRKRISSGVLHRSSSSQSNDIEQITSFLQNHLNIRRKNSRNNKNIIVINYKPVFVKSRQQKSTKPEIIPVPTQNDYSSPIHHNRRRSMTTTTSSDRPPVYSKTNHSLNRQSPSLDVPDVEDPFMFIEMMYQQLFTEDGQLRSETEPAVLANCVKQIVTNSRRNSMVRRDSISPNIHQQNFPSSFHHLIPPSKATSLSPSPYFLSNTYREEEDEEADTSLTPNRTTDTSRRSSKRLSIENINNHPQQLHAFLNSCRHRRRTSKTQTAADYNHPFSIDDTDNDDLDTFSDLNSYRKTIRTSPPASIDEDITQTDSKLLSSSGYLSLKSTQPNRSKIPTENPHHYCPNCINASQIAVIPPTSLMNIIQPIREIFMKYLNVILISKNVLLVPLFIFILRQRSMNTRN